ncbi:OLC1v1018610C1 [Oldenlandia corymbosa var. corymbosa]|uniref:OLC1v1018610C1 n=1 Tax=Oldenlandia corymbosa var. corymbosa TaxID=529605 RepID=A0AAV1EC42_OLDCO|nr:OLC1v1018610C1 [Oldenlandia corymbosa var. corymbosa]
MAWNGPYFINVYWRNKYVVEDGTIRTFDNRADATLVIERKLSYSEFLGRICDKAGWDRNYVNLRINLLFENNGVRRSATITDDSSVEIIYYFSGSSYLELYVENEDTVQAQNLLDLSGQKQDVTFVSQQDQQYWMNNSQHAEAGPSRSSGDGYVAEGHGGHVYSDIGDYKNSILDRDEFEVKMWKGDRENLDLNTCFNNRDEVEAAIEDWNIYHNRQFYVLSSGRKSWSAECATRRMQTPIGQSTCAWRMHASLKKNGLWQIVSWVDRHNCVGITRQNDHRNLRSKLIARLIRRSVENDPGFKVKSIRDAVKEAYKVDVKYKKAWHARRKAIEACYGSWIDNFTELPWYMAALQKSNPNTVVEWKWHNGFMYCLRHVRSNMVAKHKKQIARTNLVCWKMGKKRQNHKFLKFQQQLRECNEAGLAYMMAIPRGRAVVESTLAKTIKFFRDQYADALKCNTPIGDKYWKKFCWRRIGKGGNEHKVEYRDWRCSCKKWQTYRLPCSHALAIWAYERIPRIRPIRKNPEDDDHTLALGSRWRCSLDFSQVASHCLPAQRDQLASLRKVEDFIWQPYEGVEIPERCTRGRDHWQSNTWLICWDVIEPHQVDRVMRQFGFKQFIPPQPMIVGFQEWEKLHKYGRTGRGGNNWELHHREYIEKWNNRADSIVAGSPSAQSSTDDDYLPWYESNTIKFIKNPNKYNFQEEGYREHSDRAKFYADALSDICKMVEDYKKSEDVCQNSVCTNLLLELTSHSMSALSLGAHEMPILIPTQSLVDLQPQPSQPVGKVRKRNIPHRGIGGGRQKIVEEEEPKFDFELNADLFQTPTPHHQDEANQEGESTNMDVESSLPLALARPRRKLKKVNRYTPSTAQPEEELSGPEGSQTEQEGKLSAVSEIDGLDDEVKSESLIGSFIKGETTMCAFWRLSVVFLLKVLLSASQSLEVLKTCITKLVTSLACLDKYRMIINFGEQFVLFWQASIGGQPEEAFSNHHRTMRLTASTDFKSRAAPSAQSSPDIPSISQPLSKSQPNSTPAQSQLPSKSAPDFPQLSQTLFKLHPLPTVHPSQSLPEFQNSNLEKTQSTPGEIARLSQNPSPSQMHLTPPVITQGAPITVTKSTGLSRCLSKENFVEANGKLWRLLESSKKKERFFICKAEPTNLPSVWRHGKINDPVDTNLLMDPVLLADIDKLRGCEIDLVGPSAKSLSLLQPLFPDSEACVMDADILDFMGVDTSANADVAVKSKSKLDSSKAIGKSKKHKSSFAKADKGKRPIEATVEVGKLNLDSILFQELITQTNSKLSEFEGCYHALQKHCSSWIEQTEEVEFKLNEEKVRRRNIEASLLKVTQTCTTLERESKALKESKTKDVARIQFLEEQCLRLKSECNAYFKVVVKKFLESVGFISFFGKLMKPVVAWGGTKLFPSFLSSVLSFLTIFFGALTHQPKHL